MLRLVFFRKDFRCFKHGDTIFFKPGVNLLVGDQGCGKSTIIDLLRSLGSSKKISATFSKIDDANKIIITEISTETGNMLFKSYDFEKQNPRTLSYFDHDGIGVSGQIAAMKGSHGEFVLNVIESISKIENHIIMFDEPDMALSPRSAGKLANAFKQAAKNNCQIIASVHNPIVIHSQSEVLSLEHKKWINSVEFLMSHLND